MNGELHPAPTMRENSTRGFADHVAAVGLGEAFWTGAGLALGLAFYWTAGHGTAWPAAGVFFLLSLRSAPAGFAALLFSTVFSAKIDLWGQWIYSLHVVALGVVAGLILQAARRSERRGEILLLACALAVLPLAIVFTSAATGRTLGSGFASAAPLVFLLLLSRFSYTSFRETSRAFAWCSSTFFLFLALAAAVSPPSSWSFLRYAELWVVAAVAASCLRVDQARLLLWLFLLVAAAAAAWGVAQHFRLTAAGPFPVGEYVRASATFGQPNPFGGFLAMAIGAAFAVSIREAPRRAGMARFLLLLLSVGLFATSSRGAVVASFAAVLVSSALAGRRGAGLGRIGIAFALLLAGSVPFWWNGTLGVRWERLDWIRATRADRAGAHPDGSGKERTAGGIAQRWIGLETAAAMIADHPWFGIGSGRYTETIGRYAPPALDDTYADNHVHNLYLQVWIESGVFVLAAFVAGWCAFFVQAARGLDAEPTLVLAAIGIVVAACVHDLFDVLFVHGIQLLLGFAFALPILASHRRSSVADHRRVGPKGRRVNGYGHEQGREGAALGEEISN